MKILFFIASYKGGQGGHYHSLDHISRQLALTNKIQILVIGSGHSPILENNPYFRNRIFFDGVSFSKFNKDIKREIHNFSPDIIHCFDPGTYLILQLLPALARFKLVVNRCGGPNPRRRNWIVFDNLIVFSNENFEWIKNNKRYCKTNLYNIPNRVFKVSVKDEEFQLEKKETEKFNFVRIARIGSHLHLESIWKSIYLLEELHKEFPVKLYLIGNIEKQDEYEKLQEFIKEKKLPVFFITDERTKKASEMLYLADCVIGIGRSLMEAMSLGLPVLAPASNSDFPILVDNTTFHLFQESNFSQRCQAPEIIIKANLNNVKQLITDKSFYLKTSQLSENLFNKYLNINDVNQKYLGVYNKALVEKRRRYFYQNALYTVQALYSSYKMAKM